MQNSGLTDDDLAVITAEFKKRPEIEEAVLYGSRALGTFGPGSDVDIAIKGDKVTDHTRSLLHFDLEEEVPLPYFFDITDYNTIRNDRLKAHIDRYGKPIYKKGYRLTKDGELVPEEWEETTLGEMATFNASSLGKDIQFEEIIYLDTGSITEGKIDSLKTFSVSEAPSRAKRLVKNNDIVYSTVRPNQKHYGFIRNPKDNLVVSTGFATISANTDCADAKFLYYFLTQDAVTTALQQIAEHSTSTYPSIKPDHLERLKIARPSVPEQQAIAAVLSSLDDKIELLREQNNVLEETVQAIFKEWFGGYSADRPNELPEGWRVGKLGEIVNLKQGKYIEAENISDTKTDSAQFPIYGGNGIRGYLPNFVYETTQVVLTCRGNGCGLIQFTEPKATVTNSCMVLEDAKSELSANYLYLLTSKMDFESVTSGSAQPQITVTNVQGIEILVPEKNILKNFNELIRPIFKKIRENSSQIQTLSTLRDILLLRLIRGEVRVNFFNVQ